MVVVMPEAAIRLDPTIKPTDDEIREWMTVTRGHCRFDLIWWCNLTYPHLTHCIHRLIDVVDRYHAQGRYDMTLRHLKMNPFFYDRVQDHDMFQADLVAVLGSIRHILVQISIQPDMPIWMVRIATVAARLLAEPVLLSKREVYEADGSVATAFRVLIYTLVDIELCHRQLATSMRFLKGKSGTAVLVAVYEPPDVDEWAPLVMTTDPRYAGDMRKSIAFFVVPPPPPPSPMKGT